MPSAIVVDDSPIMRSQLGKLLQTAGFSVVAQAPNADPLLALYEQHRPDLVTMDIVMPGRDGAAAATELLQRYPQAVVVMCTSLSSRDKVDACLRAGVKCYLIKPFNPDYALSVFRHVLSYTTRIPVVTTKLPLIKLDDVAAEAVSAAADRQDTVTRS
jgi:two-component system chemotaxis response regulator CheY